MFWDASADAADPCHCSSDKCCCCKPHPDDHFTGKPDELSLYDALNITPGTSGCQHRGKRRRALEDVDTNSQDSGRGTACDGLSSPARSYASSIDDFLDISSVEEVGEDAAGLPDVSDLVSKQLANENSPPGRAAAVTKRPNAPKEASGTKRYKTSLSYDEGHIKWVLQKTEPDLIGDFSKEFCLPMVPGNHSDLKSVTPTVVAGLIRGDFSGCVASFKVIDCRFPYEFAGGHITGAVNLYTREQIAEEFLGNRVRDVAPRVQDDFRRNILVFHCEFSSKRGPNLLKFLRKEDRTHNMMSYPHLYFPEVYLLHGGYKNFYEHYPEYCVPNAYLPMLHPAFLEDLKFFRSKSKTLEKDPGSKSSRSLSFKRL